MKKVLILGGAGFIGSHLAESLLDSYIVRIFDKTNFSKKNIKSFEDKLEIFEGDFNNIKDVERCLEDVNYIFHLVWSTLPSSSNKNCIYDVEANVISTLKLLEKIKNRKETKIIFVSSGGTVYGDTEKEFIDEKTNNNPVCSYGITKLMIEKYLYLYSHLYDLDYNIVRISNPYGPKQNWKTGQGLIISFLHNIINNKPIEIWGDGNVVRDYIYIKDVIECLQSVMMYEKKEKIFNISNGIGYSINDIVEKIKNIVDEKVNIIYKESRKLDVQRNVLNNSLAKKELCWKSETNLEIGIKKTYEWMKMVSSE